MAKTEEIQLNTQEELTDEVESGENVENKDSNFWDKAKNIITNKEVMKQVGKTAIGSFASIAGIKSFYDVPAYFKQKFEVVKDKKQYNEIFSNIGNEEVDESEIADKKVVEIVDLNQIDVMQDKIESMDVPEEIKDKLTQELNSLVENYHTEMETLKTGENEKLTATLDEYVKTKISGVQALKNALNTLFVASGAYGLRGLSYGALSVYERQQKLKQEANKEGKEVDFMKDVIIGGAKETFKNIAFKGEGTKMQKTLKAIKSFGSLARFAGIAETSISAPENYDEAIDKLLDTLDGETDWGEAGRNFVQNIENKIPFVGDVEEAEASENLSEQSNKDHEEWMETLFTDKGKNELMKVMEEVAGKNAEQAFQENINTINAQVNAYTSGMLSKEKLHDWLEQFNDALEEKGAKTDVIDVNEVMGKAREWKTEQRLAWLTSWRDKKEMDFTDKELMDVAKGNWSIAKFEEIEEKKAGKSGLGAFIHKKLEEMPDNQKEISADGKTYSVDTPMGNFTSFKADRGSSAEVLPDNFEKLSSEQQEEFNALKKWATENKVSVNDNDLVDLVLGEDENIDYKDINSDEIMDNSFKSSIYTADGKEQFMKAMKKLAGSHAQEAYKQNFAIIQAEINSYMNGGISQEELVKWSQEMNEKMKSIGAKSDVIDIQKLLKLKPNVISSGGSDEYAW